MPFLSRIQTYILRECLSGLAMVLGLLVLDRVFERLEYETFMLQPGA